MSFIATAIVGGAVIGAGASIYSARQQAKAAEKGAAISNEQWKQEREDLAPWRAAGERGLTDLQSLTNIGGEDMRNYSMDDFVKDPGYQFRMEEGRKAIERSANARGSLFSGGTLKSLTRYNQDFASNEFGNAFNRNVVQREARFNRLASIAGIGQTATQQAINSGQNNLNNQLSAVSAKGNAYAAGTTGIANAANSGISNAIAWNYLNKM